MRGAGGASGGVMMVHRGGDRSDHSLGPSQFNARIWISQGRKERGVYQHEVENILSLLSSIRHFDVYKNCGFNRHICELYFQYLEDVSGARLQVLHGVHHSEAPELDLHVGVPQPQDPACHSMMRGRRLVQRWKVAFACLYIISYVSTTIATCLELHKSNKTEDMTCL